MATSKTPIDLREYMPDDATADAMAEEPARYNRDVDPALLERLAELKRRTSSPDILPAAPASFAVYVPPTELQAGRPEDAASPRAKPKVEIDTPLPGSEYPTLPSLKRLEGEPEMPGVEKGARGQGHGKAPLISVRPVTARGAAVAVLVVVAPVLLVILVMGSGKRNPELAATSPMSVATGSEAAAKPSGVPSAAASVALVPSAEPSATASTAVPVGPTSAGARQKPRNAVEDPYDAAPSAASSVTAAPQATAEPSAAPPTVKSAPPPYVEERPEF
jgi:hypothetical protein